LKRFVVVSGFPGSGKSTLARRLAPKLNLPLIDKDTILEKLLDVSGTGDRAQRRKLSRESDLSFREEALGSSGAVLVSHWHLEGMPSDSGTPTEWLLDRSHCVVNVHCICTAELAAERMFRRKRHPGHCDEERSYQDVLDSILSVACMTPLGIGQRFEIDTSQESDINVLARKISSAFRNHPR
jgi:hypothetical protein